MTGRDLMCAIAEIDEGIVSESGQFSAVGSRIKAARKRTRRRFAMLGLAAVICLAVFGVMKLAPGSPRFLPPSDTTGIQTPGGFDPSETGDVAAVTEPLTTGEEDVCTAPSGEQDTTAVRGTEIPSPTAAQDPQTAPTGAPNRPETRRPTEAPSTTEVQEFPTSTPPATQAPTETPSTTEVQEFPTSTPPATQAPTEAPSTTKAQETSAVPSTEEPTPVQDPTFGEEPTLADETRVSPQNPDVYRDVIVDYATARETFAHPIKSCESSDFTNYRAVIVYPNGDLNASGAYCLSVTYVFTNGYIDLRDQNRMADGITPTGNAYEYQGRTFYVHLPEFNGDRVRVEYFPTGKSGIAYQAFFDRQADVHEIMDLIISIEI